MQMSYEGFKEDLARYLKEKFKKGSTILDVGAGNGVYSDLLSDHFEMDAVEVFSPYIEEYELNKKYRTVFNYDIVYFMPKNTMLL